MLAKNPKQKEKRTWGLCPQSLRDTFGAAARQGCGGLSLTCVPHLTGGSALCPAVQDAAVGLMWFA